MPPKILKKATLKKFKEENFPKKKTREEVEAELNSIDSINETMNKMMNSMSKDFDLDLQNVNMDFANNINKELVCTLHKKSVQSLCNLTA